MFEMRKKLDELTRENEQLKAGLGLSGDMSDAQLLRIMAAQVERLYTDKFGEESLRNDASDGELQDGDKA